MLIRPSGKGTSVTSICISHLFYANLDVNIMVVKILNSFIFLVLCEILFIFPGGIVFEILGTTMPTLNENVIFLIAFLFSALSLLLCLKAFFPEVLVRIIDLLQVHKYSVYLLTAMFVLSGLLYSIIVIAGIKFESVVPRTSGKDTGLVNVFFLSLAAIFCSAVEEIFFRGAVLSFFLRRLKPWISILIISMVFSLGHMQYTGIMPHISAFIFGVLASIMVIKTNTLHGAIGLHSGWNFAFSIHSLYFDFDNKTYPHWGSSFELLEIVILVLMLFFLWLYSRNQVFLKPANEHHNLLKC